MAPGTNQLVSLRRRALMAVAMGVATLACALAAEAPSIKWTLETNDPAAASLEPMGNVAKVTFAGKSDNPLSVRVNLPPAPLAAGETYSVVFRVRAAKERPFRVITGEKGANGPNLGLNQALTALPKWRTHRLDFTPPHSAADAVVTFALGGDDIPIELADARLFHGFVAVAPRGSAMPATRGSDSTRSVPLSPESFTLTTEPGCVAKLVIDEKNPTVVRVKLDSLPSSSAWQVQLSRRNLPLRAGEAYTLSFHARADKPRTFYLGLSRPGDPVENIGFHQEFLAPTSWKEYRLTIIPTEGDDHARLYVNVGNSATPLEIGDFFLSGPNISPASLAAASAPSLSPPPSPMPTPPPSPSQPAPTSPDNVAGWKILAIAPTGATAEAIQGPSRAIRVNVTGAVPKEAFRAVARGLDPVGIKEKQNYVASVQARSDQPRPITASVSQPFSPFDVLGLHTDFVPTKEWKRFSWTFTGSRNEPKGAFLFHIGSGDSPVELAAPLVVPVDWRVFARDGGAATLSVVAAEPPTYRVDIEKLPTKTDPYAIQFSREGIDLGEAKPRVLAFRAKADKNRSINVAVTQAHPPFENLGLFKNLDLTTQWQNFSMPFTNKVEAKAGLYFNLGAEAAAVEIADPKLSAP